MLYSYVNILRNALKNMYQIDSLVYRKYVCGMLEGEQFLTVLHTLVFSLFSR